MSKPVFTDIPGLLNDMYTLISRVVNGIGNLRRRLSDREIKKLVTDFKRGVQTINLVCIKITAKDEVNRRKNIETRISSSERDDIEEKIDILTRELNRIVETNVMVKYLSEHPELAEKAYMKLYGEMEDVTSYKDIHGDTSEGFLRWIDSIRDDTMQLLSELDKAIANSFHN